MAGPGEEVGGLESAQLRRTAQNEIHRRKEQHGEQKVWELGHRMLGSHLRPYH